MRGGIHATKGKSTTCKLSISKSRLSQHLFTVCAIDVFHHKKGKYVKFINVYDDEDENVNIGRGRKRGECLLQLEGAITICG